MGKILGIVALVLLAAYILSLPLSNYSSGNIPSIQLPFGWRSAGSCHSQKECVQGNAAYVCNGFEMHKGLPFTVTRDATPACGVENNNFARVFNALSIVVVFGVITLIDAKFFYRRPGAKA